MFIVYSPEGRNFIGDKGRIDSMPVSPIKKPVAVEKDVLEGEVFDPSAYKNKAKPVASAAVKAYQVNQQGQQRRIIVKASEVMVSPVVLVADDATVEEAWHLMQSSNVHFLPVMRSGELVGMCTESDLLGRVIVDQLGVLEGVKPDTVAEVMHTEVITTTGDTDIRHIAAILAEYDVGALVVMNEVGGLIGIVTRTDLIKRLANDPPVELYT
ncbi:MAG: CBS domain-containing protein [Gammaproteobacteria bacterium]|nr:CBS domain-containing protein [Gammaproteobacteria bacterium]